MVQSRGSLAATLLRPPRYKPSLPFKVRHQPPYTFPSAACSDDSVRRSCRRSRAGFEEDVLPWWCRQWALRERSSSSGISVSKSSNGGVVPGGVVAVVVVVVAATAGAAAVAVAAATAGAVAVAAAVAVAVVVLVLISVVVVALY